MVGLRPVLLRHSQNGYQITANKCTVSEAGHEAHGCFKMSFNDIHDPIHSKYRKDVTPTSA